MMALSACPPCCKPQGYQLDIYHQSKLYDSDKIGYMLEALRINGPPVAGSHKVRPSPGSNTARSAASSARSPTRQRIHPVPKRTTVVFTPRTLGPFVPSAGG